MFWVLGFGVRVWRFLGFGLCLGYDCWVLGFRSWDLGFSSLGIGFCFFFRGFWVLRF